MAVDKLVDSTQLDADLTSVANAIRAKSGGSSQLAFPAGFVSEIGNIPSGGSGDDYGTFTPAENTLSMTVTVSKQITGVMVKASSATPYGNGARCFGALIYDSAATIQKLSIGCNTAGTAPAGWFGNASITVTQDGNSLTVTTTDANNGGYFIAGITYDWRAW